MVDVNEASLVAWAQPTQQALKLSGNPLLRPSMRGPAHLNTTVDAESLKLESRGRITSRPHFSGEEDSRKTPAGNPDGFHCRIP